MQIDRLLDRRTYFERDKLCISRSKTPSNVYCYEILGKKPHNIWGKYIENYTLENDIILDPFSGSAVAAFEAVKCGRKAIAFDINPLTAFIIEVYSTKFDEIKFKSSVNKIIKKVNSDINYKKNLPHQM